MFTDFLDVLRTPLTRQCNITAGQFPCLKKGCYEEHQVSCDWPAGDLNTHLLLVDRSATAATTARTDTTRASAETQPWPRRSRLSGAVHVYYIQRSLNLNPLRFWQKVSFCLQNINMKLFKNICNSRFRLSRFNRYSDFYDIGDGEWGWFDENIDEDREQFIVRDIPLTTDRWYFNVFSISKEHGIAILDQPEPFDSIRPIHFYCEAPSEVHRGESVGIRCMIMNR